MEAKAALEARALALAEDAARANARAAKLEADVTVASGALCAKVVGEIRESGPGGGRVGQQQRRSVGRERGPGARAVTGLSACSFTL